MKTIKICLAFIVISAITFFTIRSLVTSSEVEKTSLIQNPFIELVVKKIDLISTLPDSKFNKDVYNEASYFIEEYLKPHPPQYPYGRLGESQSDNDQWKKILTSNLYSAYADKFIKQAFYVFNGSQWKSDDLILIRNEFQILRKSPFLAKHSLVDNRFAEIQTIFAKYDEINNFITSCKYFYYPGTGSALANQFPIDQVRGKIEREKKYRIGHLENSHVNNCLRLHNELKEIPQTLFYKHVFYLDEKIKYWSGVYSKYNSQQAYSNSVYTPVKNEINALEKEMYNSPDFDSEYTNLMNKWDADATKAYKYFNN